MPAHAEKQTHTHAGGAHTRYSTQWHYRNILGDIIGGKNTAGLRLQRKRNTGRVQVLMFGVVFSDVYFCIQLSSILHIPAILALK